MINNKTKDELLKEAKQLVNSIDNMRASLKKIPAWDRVSADIIMNRVDEYGEKLEKTIDEISSKG